MEHFSKDAQKIIASCESIAFHFGHGLITSEHLLLAILKDKELPLTKELAKAKIDYDNVAKKIKNKYIKKDKDPLYMEYSVELKLLLTHADIIAKSSKEESVNLDAIIAAIFCETNSLAYELLFDLKVKMNDYKKTTNQKRNIDIESIPDLYSMSNLKKDPLIGRENELQQLINALSRRNKPNAILVGAPGVGKTAIVEELASLLEEDKIPSLKNKRIYEFDIAATVGGTKYRGEFEEKIKKILKKVKEAQNIILFVDEIHNIVHAGGAEGAIDASNILKPYLSRGDIQMIGATTEDEFESFFEKDKPLKRRFQVIHVSPSTKEETNIILKKLKPIYEDYYHTKISDDVLEYIVDLADLYLKEQAFPDKAIDVLDNTLVMKQDTITKEDVEKTFALYYKIENIDEQKINRVCEALKKEIYGQNEALLNIKNALKSALNQNANDSPSLSLLFVGPSGVGKSKAAFIIGETLYGKDNICYLNLSQYQDPYALNRLIINRINYGDENIFIKKIKNHPHTLLILDELEKANIEVLDFFTQILDNGGFYDANGKYIQMNNVMIIMLTNYGFEENLFSNEDPNYSLESIKRKLANYFRKELLSRLDDIILFSFLNKEAGKKIMGKYYDRVAQEFSLEFDNKEYRHYGARYLKKYIKNLNNKKINS